MKKICGIVPFVSFCLLVALLNVILFLTIPEGANTNSTFWLTWGFAFPLNFIIQTALFCVRNHKISKNINKMPVFQYLLFGAFIIYSIICFICAYLSINAHTFILIIELVLTTQVIVLSLFMLNVLHSFGHTKNKVAFIREVKAILCSSAAFLSGDEAKAVLSFAEKVSYSDPMSQKSLEAVEKEILQIANEIFINARKANTEKVLRLVQQGEIQLQIRNNLCITLK